MRLYFFFFASQGYNVEIVYMTKGLWKKKGRDGLQIHNWYIVCNLKMKAIYYKNYTGSRPCNFQALGSRVTQELSVLPFDPVLFFLAYLSLAHHLGTLQIAFIHCIRPSILMKSASHLSPQPLVLGCKLSLFIDECL